MDHVGRGSFCGLLASMRGKLFQDEDFAELYCADNGRDSVPPSLLATALLLQTHDRTDRSALLGEMVCDADTQLITAVDVRQRF